MPIFPKLGRKKFSPLHSLDSWDYPLGDKTNFIRFSFNSLAKSSNGACFSVRLMICLRFHDFSKLNKRLVEGHIKKELIRKIPSIDASQSNLNEYAFSNESQEGLCTLLKTQDLVFISLKGQKDPPLSIHFQ